MKLSVIIPVYNVEQYIRKCIYSVLENDFKAIDYEIIIVDDESKDGSAEIVKEIMLGYSNIKLISQKNKGLGGARNTGIKAASGDYLLFLDADDWCLPFVFQKILTIASTKQLDILEFAAQGILPNGQVSYHYAESTTAILDGINYYNSVRYMHSACNKLYNKDFLVNNDLFFLERIFIEDFEFNTRAFSKAQRVFAADILVSQFLQSPNSITRNSSPEKSEKMVNDIIYVLEKTKETYQHYTSSNDTFAIKNYFEERLGFIAVTLFYQLFKNKISFPEMQKIKQKLVEQELFYIEHAVFQKDKDLFRRVMLHHFWLFQITQPLLRFI